MKFPDHLKSAHEKLLRGTHITSEDGPMFYDIRDRFDEYQSIFSALGLSLVLDARGFVYLDGQDESKTFQRIEQLTLFTFLLIDQMADEGSPIFKTLFRHDPFSLNEVLSSFGEARIRLLRDCDLRTPADWTNMLRYGGKFGFLQVSTGANEFTFTKAIHRIVDVALNAATDLQDAIETEDETTEEDQGQ